jgi:caffeoyl-CoA O-methyltransferase
VTDDQNDSVNGKPRSFFLTDDLLSYMLEHSSKPDDIQESLKTETQALGDISRMQVAHDQAMFLFMLVSACQPSFAIEIGTFTGYSSLSIARGLPVNGRLVCCDISDDWTSIARKHWEQANLLDQIDLILAPALETLNALPDDTKIDFAFIDADKGNYIEYYEAILPRISKRGLIVADNVLWSGRVLDEDAIDADTLAIQNFNRHIANDNRITSVMLSVGDGLTVIQLAR